MNCPHCGKLIQKSKAKQPKDAGQKKYVADVKRALEAIRVLEACSIPELRAACDAEILRLRIAIGNESKLWAIYRRSDKYAGYGNVIALAA